MKKYLEESLKKQVSKEIPTLLQKKKKKNICKDHRKNFRNPLRNFWGDFPEDKCLTSFKEKFLNQSNNIFLKNLRKKIEGICENFLKQITKEINESFFNYP